MAYIYTVTLTIKLEVRYLYTKYNRSLSSTHAIEFSLSLALGHQLANRTYRRNSVAKQHCTANILGYNNSCTILLKINRGILFICDHQRRTVGRHDPVVAASDRHADGFARVPRHRVVDCHLEVFMWLDETNPTPKVSISLVE